MNQIDFFKNVQGSKDEFSMYTTIHTTHTSAILPSINLHHGLFQVIPGGSPHQCSDGIHLNCSSKNAVGTTYSQKRDCNGGTRMSFVNLAFCGVISAGVGNVPVISINTDTGTVTASIPAVDIEGDIVAVIGSAVGAGNPP